MTSREEIEQNLEASLAVEIKHQVEIYQDLIEIREMKLGANVHAPQERKNMLKRKEEQIKKELMRPQDRDRIEQGFQIILSRLDALPNKQRIEQELEAAKTKFDLNHIDKDAELQEVLGLSNDTYNAFYDISIKVLQEEGKIDDLEKPLCAFLYLTQLNKRYYEPYLYLGYCYQAKKEYDMALNAYWNASTLAPKNLEPYIRSAECYLATHQIDRANELLKIMEIELVQSPDFPAYQEWISRLKIATRQSI